MKTMTPADRERLESLITAYGYGEVLEALAELIDQAAGNLLDGGKRKLFLGAGKVRAAAKNVSEALP